MFSTLGKQKPVLYKQTVKFVHGMLITMKIKKK